MDRGEVIGDDLQRFLNSYDKPLMQCEQTPFFNQLCGLKDKISLFRDVFYAKKPKYEEGWNPEDYKNDKKKAALKAMKQTSVSSKNRQSVLPLATA